MCLPRVLNLKSGFYVFYQIYYSSLECHLWKASDWVIENGVLLQARYDQHQRSAVTLPKRHWYTEPGCCHPPSGCKRGRCWSWARAGSRLSHSQNLIWHCRVRKSSCGAIPDQMIQWFSLSVVIIVKIILIIMLKRKISSSIFYREAAKIFRLQ